MSIINPIILLDLFMAIRRIFSRPPRKPEQCRLAKDFFVRRSLIFAVILVPVFQENKAKYNRKSSVKGYCDGFRGGLLYNKPIK